MGRVSHAVIVEKLFSSLIIVIVIIDLVALSSAGGQADEVRSIARVQRAFRSRALFAD